MRGHYPVYVQHGEEDAWVAKLSAGLVALGAEFLAQFCWWCHGTTRRDYEHCQVCGKYGYGTAQGLLVGNEPAPASVINQVLVAAERAGDERRI